MLIRAELELLLLTDSAGLNRSLVTALIKELKEETLEADRSWQTEATNLHNAKDEAVEALQTVLYNLRNA